MKFERIVYAITIIFAVLFIYVGHNIASQGSVKTKSENNIVLKEAEVVSVDDSGDAIKFDFFFSDEKMGDERKTAKQLDNNTSKKVSVGDKIFVTKDTSNQKGDYIFFDYIRIDKVMYLTIAFLIMVLVFGRLKGLNTIISLVFTLLALFYVFLPAILSGQNVYLWAIVVCIAIVVFTLIVVHGPNKKSVASGLGTILGLLFSGVVMYISSGFFNFTGLTSEEAMYLKFNNVGLNIDIKAIFYTTIIIGALGAVMDVAMSIASSLYEFKELKPELTIKEMVKLGYEIGKDILGTMTNTLILAYVGSGFTTVILVVAFNDNLLQIYNKEFLVAHIFEPLIGSFGIVATLPITSVICAYMFNRFNKNKKINSTIDTDKIAIIKSVPLLSEVGTKLKKSH